MRIAVVTPVFHTPAAWLEQCLASVASQPVPCTHFAACDGDVAFDFNRYPRAHLLRLPGPHRDNGNAARAAGSVSAVCKGFDVIAYLDADNWYEPDHLERLVQLHRRTGTAVCSSGRTLYGLDGRRLGRCPEVDGEQFADTSCLFFTRRRSA